ncbi:MAG: hypothetical protein O7E52_06820 [Candidatus Poribacteria bacterium]|nr:hypothetical protein [Candidatus Poribacteria bacterium]
MGKITATIQVKNFMDEMLVERGYLEAGDVRRIEIEAIGQCFA